eukprot:10618854-Alexandrium_andersonii.AAC.1
MFEEKLRLLNHSIAPVVLWASEAVGPTIERLRSLLRLERAMARRVFKLPRGAGEDVWDWRMRHSRQLEAYYVKLGLKTRASQSL